MNVERDTSALKKNWFKKKMSLYGRRRKHELVCRRTSLPGGPKIPSVLIYVWTNLK